jgi:hypothetical protein
MQMHVWIAEPAKQNARPAQSQLSNFLIKQKANPLPFIQWKGITFYRYKATSFFTFSPNGQSLLRDSFIFGSFNFTFFIFGSFAFRANSFRCFCDVRISSSNFL